MVRYLQGPDAIFMDCRKGKHTARYDVALLRRLRILNAHQRLPCCLQTTPGKAPLGTTSFQRPGKKEMKTLLGKLNVERKNIDNFLKKNEENFFSQLVSIPV